MAKHPGRQLNDQFMLRMPDGLRERIARAAKANGRSMNSEIVELLEQHYPPDMAVQDLLGIVGDLMDRVNGNFSWREHRKDLTYWLTELRDQIDRETGQKIELQTKKGHREE